MLMVVGHCVILIIIDFAALVHSYKFEDVLSDASGSLGSKQNKIQFDFDYFSIDFLTTCIFAEQCEKCSDR